MTPDVTMLLPAGSLRTVTTVETRPIETREVRLHGHRLVYRIGGDLASDRPVLLLVHGAGRELGDVEGGACRFWRTDTP